MFTVAPSKVSAQQSADPAQIERRIEEMKPKVRRVEPKIKLIPLKPVAPSKPEVDRFILAAVVIDGATVFDPAVFAPFYENLLAREITLADVEKILAQITKKYRDSGYILTRVVAPPQMLESGVLFIDVIEGYVDQVIYEGAKDKGAMLTHYAERIKSDQPLRLSTLERNVLLINDVSGISITPKFRPIKEDEGRYALVLEVKHKLFDSYAEFDNRGSPSVGRLQSYFSAGLNSVLGWRERFKLGFFTIPNQPRELLYYEGSYTQAVGSDGLHVSVFVSTSDLDAGSELDAREIESETTRVRLRAWYPIIRSRKQNLWVSGTLKYQDFRETEFGQTTIADRLRVARLRFNYWQSHHKGSTSISFEGSQGLNILKATKVGTPDRTRVDGRSDFTKFKAFVTRLQGFGRSFSLKAILGGQWSAHPLLSSEEFSLGGTRFGRAYDFSEVKGDFGAAGSIELRYGKNLRKKWLKAVQLYGFYDIGSVWNDVRGVGKVRASISSTGAGVRLTMAKKVRIKFEMAKPLTRFVDSRNSTSMRYFFKVSTSF